MKEKIKIYHGIPKNIIDKNTVFYASFDGVVKPEVGGLISNNLTNSQFISSATGFGLFNRTYSTSTANSLNMSLVGSAKIEDGVTFDYMINPKYVDSFPTTEHYGTYVKDLNGKLVSRICAIYNNGTVGDKLLINIRFYNSSDTNIGSISGNLIKKDKWYHIRVIMKKANTKLFIDGCLVSESNVDVGASREIRYISHGSTQYIISDFSVSNIDREDLFPNLPQDYIEGKAIIKERLGQQQIKGDPVIGQSTVLKVTNYNKIDLADNPLIGGKRFYRGIPELCTTGSQLWDSGATISIKGLHSNETIAGVIDTDTALARITKDNKNFMNITEICVDDVSKLSVGDTIKVYVPYNNVCSHDATISAINPTSKVLTLASALIDNTGSKWGEIDLAKWGENYIIETTATSSLPIVRSEGGQQVVGTWAGLGTNSATFTLGGNTPSLNGKDLYVSYSLNMPSNNSHFAKIPYSVDKAFTETGVEMSPTNEVMIVDDFKGKVSGNLKVCGHWSKHSNANTYLVKPNTSIQELPDAAYKKIENRYGLAHTISTNNKDIICQQIIAFNVVDIIEKKLGCPIPSSNKAQWIKDNGVKGEFMFSGYCQTPSGKDVNIGIFNNVTNEWQTPWKTFSMPSLAEVTGGFGIDTSPHIISDNGFIYFIIYPESKSDGAVATTLYSDYVKLTITLKAPTGFDTLYCKNKRSREDVCNPVLVNKITKTVRRLLPSRDFFVTEGQSGEINKLNKGDVVYKSNFIYLSSQGTGCFEYSDDYYAGCLAKLGCTPNAHRMTGDIMKDIPQHPPLRFARIIADSYYSNNDISLPSEMRMGSYVAMHPSLGINNNELVLRILCREVVNSTYTNHKPYIICSLPNRPLIK